MLPTTIMETVLTNYCDIMDKSMPTFAVIYIFGFLQCFFVKTATQSKAQEHTLGS